MDSYTHEEINGEDSNGCGCLVIIILIMIILLLPLKSKEEPKRVYLEVDNTTVVERPATLNN
jgi:hypothetical protein